MVWIRIRIRRIFFVFGPLDPHSDSLVRGMDPRIRIHVRIRSKMLWIRNTDSNTVYFTLLTFIQTSSSLKEHVNLHNPRVKMDADPGRSIY
jgi:hypothetical protein